MDLSIRALHPVVRHLPWVPSLLHRVRQGWLGLRRPVTLGVRVLVSDDGGRVLLVRHSYLDGWFLPGGAVDRGETVWAAAGRELAEETGLQAAACGTLFGLYANFSNGISNHVALVPVTAWTGSLAVDGFEIVDAAFFSMTDLPDDTSPATRRRIAEVRREAALSPHW